jgi:hypothetical protein
MAERRGKKENHNKNYSAHKEWMIAKKLGRKKQKWVWTLEPSTMGGEEVPGIGHWEKVR